MPVVSIATLKSYFNTGDTPTEPQYVDLIDTLAALPSSGGAPVRQQLSASGLTCGAVFFGSGSATLTNTGAGLFTLAFTGTATPARAVVAFTDANLSGTGALTLTITNANNLQLFCNVGLRRQDAGKLVVFDPLGEFAINCAETVTGGSTTLAFENMNNLGATGAVITIELLTGLETS
jgi:hypothetical protein